MGRHHTGGCMCGAVRFEAEGPLRAVIACHCRECQRASSHYVTATAAQHDRFSITEDRGLGWYSHLGALKRGFCRECGSSLFWQPTFADYISVAAGSIDQPSGLTMVRHIYTIDVPDWYEIGDDLEQIETSLYGRET